MKYDDKGVKKCVADRTRRVAGWMAGIMLAAILAGCGQMERPAGIAEDGRDAAEVAEKGAGGTEEIGAARADTAGAQEAEAGGAENSPATMADLLRESGNVPEMAEAPELPETVLWFNATYACLTYTNGCDWRWVVCYTHLPLPANRDVKLLLGAVAIHEKFYEILAVFICLICVSDTHRSWRMSRAVVM